ncbi:hypothetical protein ACFOOL_01345 [Devosia honganensis]|uniref:Uncharacterized protein n=1 Tax=Devosia honganensis TaxID=1610527 RepID=A0ABV7WX89_9HYPH
MTTIPPLGPRALASYRRLRVEVDALKDALDFRKPSGTMNDPTIRALETVRHRANKLFCRHADLPWFPWIADSTLSPADFTVLVFRLAAALRHFEALHADQLDPWTDDGDDFDDAPSPPGNVELPLQ